MSELKSKQRLVSLDTYRGLVLVLIALEYPNYGWQHNLAEAHPGKLTAFIEFHASHMSWAGCSMWDLIQPSFMFMVGVSMAYSFAKRKQLGDGFGKMLRHTLVRSLILIVLGIFLRRTYTETTFEDVISQIGLGYVFLFLLWNKPIKLQMAATAGILIFYWALFAFWPTRDAIPDPNWENPDAHVLTGFFAHWNINANPGHYFDQVFLNLFPRADEFTHHEEGYNTLNFIPSLAIMVMGLMAGELLRSKRSAMEKLQRLGIYGAAGILLGAILHAAGICPLVKKAWTSSFTLFSGGCCLVILAALYFIIDIKKIQKWTFPFVVCGMNSIALYCMLWLFSGFIDENLGRTFGETYANFCGPGFEPLFKNIANGIVLWLICFWMYRQKFFIKI